MMIPGVIFFLDTHCWIVTTNISSEVGDNHGMWVTPQ